MNPDLQRLQPYPFQRLAALFREVQPNPDYRAISLSIGEPKHATPQFIRDTLTANLDGLANYPTTAGSDALRGAIANWLAARYGHSGARCQGPGLAGERQPRSAVRLCPNCCRPHEKQSRRGLPQPVLPDLRGCGISGRSHALLPQHFAGKQFCVEFLAIAGPSLATHPACLCVHTRQSNRTRDAIGGMENVV